MYVRRAVIKPKWPQVSAKPRSQLMSLPSVLRSYQCAHTGSLFQGQRGAQCSRQRTWADVNPGLLRLLGHSQDARWSWVQQAFTALQWLLLGKDASTAGPVAWASIWLNLAVVIILTVASVQGFLHLLRTRAAQHRSLLGRVLPPGLGAATTLVVTDVQVGGSSASLQCP